MAAYEFLGFSIKDVGIEFDARVGAKGDKKTITNRISTEAMDDFFAAEDEPGDHDARYRSAFKKYQHEIWAIVPEAIRLGYTNDTGGADITSEFLIKIKHETHNH
jgi:hypothetical protein